MSKCYCVECVGQRESEATDEPPFNNVALSDLLSAVLRVEHNYMTLRTPTGWLLWSQKVTSEAELKTVLERAATNWNYNQGT